jgi:hypothetical protein
MAPYHKHVDLVRSWLGQAFRATGAAVAVPVAIVLALGVAALGAGGLGGAGSLAQIVSGPDVPGGEVFGLDGGDGEISDAVTELARADGGGGSAEPPAVRPGDATEPRDRDGRERRKKRDRDRSDRDPGGRDPGDGGPLPPLPPGPPGPGPGIVEGLGEELRDAGSGTPFEPALEEAIDNLVETCALLGCP